jgi:hypothetical protein
MDVHVKKLLKYAITDYVKWDVYQTAIGVQYAKINELSV